MVDEASLEDIIEAFQLAIRRGESPSIEEYEQQYPQYSEIIRDIFPTIETLESVKEQQNKEHPLTSPSPQSIERIGEYEVIREIGRGGMGIVYEAMQPSLDRKVAIKILPGLNKENEIALKRFQQEAKIAAKLDYPHIISILGMGVHQDIPFYVMRYVDGISLGHLITYLSLDSHEWNHGNFAKAALNGTQNQANFLISLLQQAQKQVIDALKYQSVSSEQDAKTIDNKLPLSYYPEIAQVISQAAGALNYAHQQGAIHRDIKPANLFLDQMAMVWIGDFGLAKNLESESLTRTQDLLGTLRYMAPERFDGEDNDSRSDIYSLGISLYELVTLKSAFAHTSPGGGSQLLSQIIQGRITPPRTLNPHIPIVLEGIILNAIHRDPKYRYQSGSEMQEALNQFVQHFPHHLPQSQTADNSPNRIIQQTENSRATLSPQKHRPNPSSKNRLAWIGSTIFIIAIGLFFLATNELQEVPEKQSPLSTVNQTRVNQTKLNQTAVNQIAESQAHTKNQAKTPNSPPPSSSIKHHDEKTLIKAVEKQPLPPEHPKKPPQENMQARYNRGELTQREKVLDILSHYHPQQLTQADAKAINNAFRAAGVRRGPEQTRAVEEAGFSPETLRRLDPPPNRPGSRPPRPPNN